MTERELEARLIHEQIPLPTGFDATEARCKRSSSFGRKTAGAP